MTAPTLTYEFNAEDTDKSSLSWRRPAGPQAGGSAWRQLLGEWLPYPTSGSDVANSDLAEDVANLRYARALAAIKEREQEDVATAVGRFLTEAVREGIQATVIAPSPEGGVTLSFGAAGGKYAFVEVYLDNTTLLALSTPDSEPEVIEGDASSTSFEVFAKRISTFLDS